MCLSSDWELPLQLLFSHSLWLPWIGRQAGGFRQGAWSNLDSPKHARVPSWFRTTTPLANQLLLSFRESGWLHSHEDGQRQAASRKWYDRSENLEISNHEQQDIDPEDQKYMSSINARTSVSSMRKSSNDTDHHSMTFLAKQQLRWDF